MRDVCRNVYNRTFPFLVRNSNTTNKHVDAHVLHPALSFTFQPHHRSFIPFNRSQTHYFYPFIPY